MRSRREAALGVREFSFTSDGGGPGQPGKCSNTDANAAFGDRFSRLRERFFMSILAVKVPM